MNRKILSLAIPNVVTNITIPLVGIIDTAIIGRWGGDLYIGAIAIGVAIFNFIYWNFGFLRMGTSGFAAQAYGARDFRESMRVLTRSLTVAGGVGVLMVLFQVPIGNFSLYIMDGQPEVMRMAGEYFFARIWAAPATLALYAFKGWFIGMQNSRTPMIIAVIINVVNVIMGVWFVFGLGWGMRGVALGTVCAQYAGLLSAIIFWFAYYRKLGKYFDFKGSMQWEALVKYFRVNSDIFIRTLCLVTVYTFFTRASAGMSNEILAVNTLLMQLFMLYSYMMDGFAYAAESLIGRYVGAKNRRNITSCIRHLMGWGVVIGILYMVVFAAWWRPILGIFSDSTAIIDTARHYVKWVLMVPLISFTAFVYDGILVGATLTRIMRNTIVIASVIFFISYYALQSMIGNDALWIAFIAYLGLRGFLQMAFVHFDRV